MGIGAVGIGRTKNFCTLQIVKLPHLENYHEGILNTQQCEQKEHRNEADLSGALPGDRLGVAAQLQLDEVHLKPSST